MTPEWIKLADIEEGFGSGATKILTCCGLLGEGGKPTQTAIDQEYIRDGLWNLVKVQAIVAVVEMVDWEWWKRGLK